MSEHTPHCANRGICMICDATYEHPQAAMEFEAEPSTAADSVDPEWGLCPSHEQLHSSGMVFIVEVDLSPEVAARLLLGSLSPEGLVRTGRVLTLPRDFVRERIDFPMEDMPATFFVPTSMFDFFSLAKRSIQ